MDTKRSINKARGIHLLAAAVLICASLLPGSTGPARAQSSPRFGVVTNEDRVLGYWPLGALVTLTIDDPITPQSPDYTDVQRTEPEPQEPEIITARFDLSGKFDIKAGHLIILTDGVITKSHIVTQVTITSVDSIADTVSGTAEPGTQVFVVAEGPGELALRVETADSVTGAWIADFSIVGDTPDEQDTFDIRPGTGGKAVQGDEDGDDTNFTWQVRDSDGDGLADDADACPTQDSTGYDANADGCLDTPEGLISLIKSMPEDAVAGKVKNSLIKDVEDAIKSLAKGKDQTAIEQLDNFIKAVENVRGKKISNEAADLLVAYARNVIRQIESRNRLNLGAMFEFGGDVSSLSRAADNAVTLAVERANAAGGILGRDVVLHHRSAGDDPEPVRQAAVDLIENRRVQAIVGPIRSSSTFAILQDTLVPARVLLVSPSNTNPRLAEIPDDGLYFRTSSSDALRGSSAGLRACALGYTTAATIHRVGDPYSQNQVIAFADAFTTCGGITRAVELVDDVGAAVRAAVASSPEVVFAPVITGDPDERVSVMQHAFCEQDGGGHLAADRYWSFGDPLRSSFVSDVLGGIPCVPGEAPEEMLAGYESMAAAFEADLGNIGFQADYAAHFGQPPTIFANTAYDAAVLVMLAAEEAKSLDPLAIRAHMVSVSTGGALVSDFPEALSLVRAGVDIDWAGTYEGVADGFTYDINHDFEPDGETILPYLISQIQLDGTMPIVAAVNADDLRGLSDP